MDRILFNRPNFAGRELDYLQQVLESRATSGDGYFTSRCQAWIRAMLGSPAVLLTNSCSTALEMAAILAELEPGDEVIMPSFTFVSTANAIVLRRAVPVFVDIRNDTSNIDESLIEAAITPKTRAICVVHYAGVCAEMDVIHDIARRHRLVVIEDAAQALLSTYRGRQAGALSDLACFSFHETKNVTSGEGGALVVNATELCERSHVIWEKGTNRRAFRSGQVDKYTWVDCGSSFLPSEFTAAILLAQLEQIESCTQLRRSLWQRYHQGFSDLDARNVARRPFVPSHCMHNGHLYYLVVRDQTKRDRLIHQLNEDGISTVFHYVPLHSSPAGSRYARSHGSMRVTDETSAGLLRLPLHSAMTFETVDRVIDRVNLHIKTL